MEIRILGAHNLETRGTRLASLLIDGVLALDAGGLSSGLTLAEQGRVRSILLTHRHFDHVRDLLTLGLATRDSGTTVEVYGIEDTIHHVRSYLINGKLYPDFTQATTTDQPKYRLNVVEPCKGVTIIGYDVTPLPVPHGPPSVGYLVAPQVNPSPALGMSKDERTPSQQKRLFYTGDTGRGVAQALTIAQPDLLIVEVTFSNQWEAKAVDSGHLTPRLLAQELALFSKERGYTPRVVTVHMHPAMEDEIRRELAQIARDLQVDITVGKEDMTVSL